MGEISGLRAIMYGGRDGLGVLTDMPEVESFAPEERIITSGEAGVFPRGLIVGMASQRDDDWRVRLAMRGVRGGYVRLLPRLDIPTPEEVPIPVEEVEISDASDTAASIASLNPVEQ